MYKIKKNKTDNIEEHFVDLGLPSGLKWSKTNLGAENETDYGNYYMWGSIIPNTADECNWANAPFNNGSGSYDYEYFDVHKSEWLDDNDNLKPEYDAAYKATDGAARMPTQDEIRELLDNTDNEWIEDYKGSGVNGRKFISKTNGNSIFIPAAGYCDDGSVDNVGGSGGVWSSSLYTSGPYGAWYLGFYSGNCYMYNNLRHYGRSVRPVTD